MTKVRDPAKLTVHLYDLRLGGVAFSMVGLAAALADRGHRVDLLLCRARGQVLAHVPDAVNVVELRPSTLFASAACMALAAPLAALALLRLYLRGPTLPTAQSIRYVPALVRYLRRERPDALLSAKTMSNLATLYAAKLARVPTRVVISERAHLSSMLKRAGFELLAPTIRRTYLRADARTACSDGVADDLAIVAQIRRDDVVTIYSAVVHPGLVELAKAKVEHPWFERDAPPVILGVGRLGPQKDFPTLLAAFARVRRRRRARLVILGEGTKRPELAALAKQLGVAADVDLPGTVRNPHAYMARASVFALSSRFEGLPRVLIEALAAGCPVVSTACPSGPEEILAGGAYGRLVPVGDARALAEALVATLDEPPPKLRLQRRARDFSVERAVDRHLDVLLGGSQSSR